MSPPLVFAAAGAWPAFPRTPVVARREGRDLRIVPGPAHGLPRMSGVLVPGVVDAHVHLGLVDAGRLAASPVVEVLDCGWIPAIAAEWLREPPTGGRVRALGPFHTPPGGYPVGRPWAPPAAVRELADATAARDAVAAVHRAGFAGVKVVVHRATPFPTGVLEALVDAAHGHGLAVHAHVEGGGTAERALGAGVDALVHTPWSERLPDELIAAAAARTTWTSTLAIHDGAALATAIDNAERFARAGGVLRYGTDLGNGPAPAGLRLDEVTLLARVLPDPDALMAALTGHDGGVIAADRAVLVPGPWPERATELAERLAGARRLVTEEAA